MNSKYVSFTLLDGFNDLINLYTKRPMDFKVNGKKYLREIIKDYNYKFIKCIKPIQVHSNIVKVVDSSNIDNEFNNCDGLITNIKGIALLTNSADCQSILIYDKNKKVIGNIHSGWKGTLNKIIVNAINIFKDTYNSNLKDIIVCICPSIHECCFEVKEDVLNMFKEVFPYIDNYVREGDIKEGHKRYYIDTLGLNKKILIDLGIKEDNIEISNICTKCNGLEFHSYRYSGNDAGRNIALICIK